MDKVDAATRGATSRLGEQQTHTALFEYRAHVVEVSDAVGELLHPGAVTVQELSDRGFLVEWGQELNLGVLGALFAGADHGLGDSLLLVDLAVQFSPAEYLGVELDGFVEIGHSQSDVIDTDEQIFVVIHDTSFSYLRHRLSFEVDLGDLGALCHLSSILTGKLGLNFPVSR